MNEIMSTKSGGNNVANVGMTEVEARQVAEIKGKMLLAKQFPRNVGEVIENIKSECRNIKLAETAIYSYSRGGTEIKGASIRLAEVIASHWGNLISGVTELEQRNGESTVKAYAWDLQSNYYDEKIFTVKHERSTKSGNYALKDPRDIYELVANNGARRKRACLFAVIPTYLIEEAVEACEETLTKDIGADIDGARVKMLNAFMALDDLIDAKHLEIKVNKPLDKFNNNDIVKLRNLYTSIKDGFIKAEDAFGFKREVEQLNAESQATKDKVKRNANKGAVIDISGDLVLEEKPKSAPVLKEVEDDMAIFDKVDKG